MRNQPAISNCLQEIALLGIKESKREPKLYGEWFHLLLLLASKGWNMSLEGEESVVPTLNKEFKLRRKELGIKGKEIEENFITTDVLEITRLFSKIKQERYPFDRRAIRAMEYTPQGSLRVYSENVNTNHDSGRNNLTAQ